MRDKVKLKSPVCSLERIFSLTSKTVPSPQREFISFSARLVIGLKLANLF